QQIVRKELRTQTRTRPELGHRDQTGALAKPRWRRPDLFSQLSVERDWVQRSFSNIEPRSLRDARARSGAARATDCQSRARGQLQISGSRKHFLQRYYAIARRASGTHAG